MKFKIGKYTYRKASDLLVIMDKAPRTEKELRVQIYLVGIYSCRFLGLVRYRTKTGIDTDKLQVGRKLSECGTVDAIDSSLHMYSINDLLVDFQHFLVLDGALDIEEDEIKRNAEVYSTNRP